MYKCTVCAMAFVDYSLNCPTSPKCNGILLEVASPKGEAVQRFRSTDGLARRASDEQPGSDTSVVSGAKAGSAALEMIARLCGNYMECYETQEDQEADNDAMWLVIKQVSEIANVELARRAAPPTLPAASGSEARPANDRVKRTPE